MSTSISQLLKLPFISNLIRLLSWSALSQIIYFICLPIVSRLYNVETFGNLSIVTSVASLFIGISAFRYEAAILLPKNDNDAFSILVLSLILVCVSSIIVTTIFLLISLTYSIKGSYSILTDLWWLIPLFQLCVGFYETLVNWAIRIKTFNLIGYTKIIQTISMMVFQIGLGVFKFGAVGLYFGDILGRASGVGNLFKLAWMQNKSLLKNTSFKQIILVAKQYASFPKYSILAIILSRLGRNFTPVIIAGIFGVNEAGSFAMASRVISAPIEFLCRSFTQVYLGEAARLSLVNPNQLKKLFQKSAISLLSIGFLPSMLFFFLGPSIFTFVFGSQWLQAGVYSKCMSIMLLLQFLNFPLVHTLNILEKQHWQLFWDGTIVVFVFAGLYILGRLGYGDTIAIIFYSLLMTLMFIIHFFVSLIAINFRIEEFKKKQGLYSI